MIKRVFRSVFCASLAVMLCSCVLVIAVLYNYHADTFRQTLQNEFQLVKKGIDASGYDYIYSLEKGNTASRVTLISADGAVIYDSVSDIAKMENHLNRQEIIDASQKGFGESSRYSKTLSERTFYYAERLDDGNILRISGTQASVLALSWGMMQSFLIILVFAVLLSALLAYAFSKATIKPINDIDLENPQNTEGLDELSPLLIKIDKQNKQIESQISELKRRQQEFLMITENMSEGFIVIDSKTNILSYNSSALRIFDVDDIDINESVFVLNRAETFRKSVEAALSGNHSKETINIGGRVYDILINPVLRKSGVAKGAVILILDVTEQEQRETLRKEFSANVSHELKTPLTSISGFAEIIKDGIAKTEDIPHFAENIYKETSRLITLVSDIIELSQLDEKAEPPQKEYFSITSIVKNIVESLQNKARKRNIDISFSGEDYSIYGIARIAEEMIYNLCDNAIVYNKNGGKVDVTLAEKENKIRLCVSDTGIGIPPEHQERIFERFYRVDKSRSKETGGTGLGLSIVKHGALIHNAEIKLKSAVNEGTEITISFDSPK